MFFCIDNEKHYIEFYYFKQVAKIRGGKTRSSGRETTDQFGQPVDHDHDHDRQEIAKKAGPFIFHHNSLHKG